MLYAIGGCICTTSVVINAFSLEGAACGTHYVKNTGLIADLKHKKSNCDNRMLKSYTADAVLKIFIVGILCYALIRICIIARKNKQRVRDVCCI